MKDKYYILLLGLMIAANASALEVACEVLNQYSEPIENAIISFESGILLTDDSGRFRIRDIQPGSTISIRKIGFQETNFEVSAIPSTIILEHSSIPLPGIKVTAPKDDNLISQQLPVKRIKLSSQSDNFELADVLAREAGTWVAGSKLSGEDQKVVIPGFEARHTLILLDGIPLNKPGEAYDISALTTTLIEEIEIYDKSTIPSGSGSIGGVLNFITRKSAKNAVSLSSGVGSFGLLKASAAASCRLNSFDLQLGYSRRFARNDFLYEAKEYWENPDSARTRMYNDKLLQDISFSIRNNRFPLSYSFLRHEFFKKLPGPTNNPELFANSRISGSEQRHILALESSIKNFRWNSTISYAQENSNYDNTRIDETYVSYLVENKTEYSSLDLKNTMQRKTDDLDLGLGFYYNRQTFRYHEYTDPDNSIGMTYENSLALSGSLDHRIDLFPIDLSWHTSLRSDHYKHDQQFSYLVMPVLGYNSIFRLEFGASLARSFTVPSFYDLYWKGDTQATGNPKLEPETGNSSQIFFGIEHELFDLEINYRSDRIENKIVWFPDYNKTWKPMNISGAEIENLTFSGNLMPWEFIGLNIVYNKTKTADRSLTGSGDHSAFWGKDLIYTPGYLLNANLRLSYHLLELNINYNRTGEQWISRDQLSNSFKLPEYDLWNADLKYSFQLFFLDAETSIMLKNIADLQYEIYEYSPQPGFNWEAALNLKYEI